MEPVVKLSILLMAGHALNCLVLHQFANDFLRVIVLAQLSTWDGRATLLRVLEVVALAVHGLRLCVLSLAFAGTLQVLVGAGTAHEAGCDFGVVDAPVRLGEFKEFEVAHKVVWLLVDAPAKWLCLFCLLFPHNLLLFEVFDELRFIYLVILLDDGLFLPCCQAVQWIRLLLFEALVSSILITKVEHLKPPFFAVHRTHRSIIIFFLVVVAMGDGALYRSVVNLQLCFDVLAG